MINFWSQPNLIFSIKLIYINKHQQKNVYDLVVIDIELKSDVVEAETFATYILTPADIV